MKKLFLLVLGICLVAIVGWWWFHDKPAPAVAPSPDRATAGRSSPLPPAAANQLPASRPSPAGILAEKYPRWLGGRSSGLGDPRWQLVNDRDKADPSWPGKMSIDFFGKVVDSAGKPVAGATARFSWTDLSPAGSSRAAATSDARGLFSLTDAKGKFLSVQVEKEGYYASKQNPSGFEFASFSAENFHQPDPDNPVVFRLREKGRAEALIHRQKLYGLKTDGTAQYLDLRTGEKTTGGAPQGDLRLSLVRKPTIDANRFDWSLVMSAVGEGGIVESREEFMLMAPEGNYEKSLTIDQKRETANYESQTRRNYYLRLADGRTYARVSVDIRPKYNEEGAIDIDLFLNPSGSRNLEFDPAKTIKP